MKKRSHWAWSVILLPKNLCDYEDSYPTVYCSVVQNNFLGDILARHNQASVFG